MLAKFLSLLVAALLFSAVFSGTSASAADYAAQGWSNEIRHKFYFTPQGSRIMPLDWFKALPRVDGTGLFSDPHNLRRYGLIGFDETGELNPHGLPIGLTVEPVDEHAPMAVPYVGMTCAACHTSDVTANGQTLRLDGAPSHFDFDSFYSDLADTVAQTLASEPDFAAFATRVLAAPDKEGIEALKVRFAGFQKALAEDAELRRPDLASGFGRVDALTQIFNSLAARDQQVPANRYAVAAPTSYPQLWLAPRLEFVQWNPIASNPFARNAGQVLGVFGTAKLSGEDRFASSIRARELIAIEDWVRSLEPPRWNEKVLGPIDWKLAERGAALFGENCAGCHGSARETDPTKNLFGQTFIDITRVDYRLIGTDPVYVESLILRRIQTSAATGDLFPGASEVTAIEFSDVVIGRVVRRSLAALNLSADESASAIGFKLRPPAPGKSYSPPSVTDLKAPILVGAWATGPYLHNGSVPTIYELLSPEAERRKVFWTGGRELDREKLGFVSTEAPDLFRFDTRLPGNRNTGHNNPPGGLAHDDRMAIIEYLKTDTTRSCVAPPTAECP